MFTRSFSRPTTAVSSSKLRNSFCTSRLRSSSQGRRPVLTHVNDSGEAHMVSVSNKDNTRRIAIASGYVQTTRQAIHLIKTNTVAKGDVLAVARVAGIMASKQTSALIPLCHNITITKAAVDLKIEEADNRIKIEATVECLGRTGVEMEALTAVSTASLTVYDMLKAIDKGMVISDIRVTSKSGGQSGAWEAG